MPRLLVLRALGLGDLLTAVPALRALRRAFPDHHRLLAAPAALRPLLELIDDDGERAVHGLVDVGPLEPLPRVAQGCEVAVNLHGKGPQSHRLLLAVRPGRLIWFEHPEVADSRGAPPWRRDEHEVGRWCRLLAESGFPADPERLELVPPADTPELLRGATIVHPGAGSAARRWPPERFAQVARAAARRGHRVVVTGGPDERPLARAVARAAGLPRESVLAGETDLGRLAQAVAAARLVVCGDTGIGHLATAFGTPSVLLFGPTSPARWGPPRDRRQHRALWAGIQGDPHAARPDPGLLAITPEQVLEELESLAADPPRLAVFAPRGGGNRQTMADEQQQPPEPPTGFPEPPGKDPGDRSHDPDPHHALNNPAGAPDPTEWPDPYDRREDPRDPEEPGGFEFGDEPHTATGATSTSEPHPDDDPEAIPSEAAERDTLDD